MQQSFHNHMVGAQKDHKW